MDINSISSSQSGVTPLSAVPKKIRKNSVGFNGDIRRSSAASVWSRTSDKVPLPHVCYSHDELIETSVKLEKTEKIGQQSEHSRQLPKQVRSLIAICLGINRKTGRRTLFGYLMLTVTTILAVGHACAHTSLIVYHMMHDSARSNILDHVVNTFVVLLVCVMGVYAFLVAGRLFQQENITNSIRCGTKTILKLNGIFILAFAGLLMIAVNGYTTYKRRYNDIHCLNATIPIPILVCHLTFYIEVPFSCVALVWNCLMGYAVLSVTRTHTIGLRKLMRALHSDGEVCVDNIKARQEMSSDYVEDTYWYGVRSEPNADSLFADTTSQNDTQGEDYINRKNSSCWSDNSDTKREMTNDELVVCYWRVEGHLRSTSEAFQRWVVCWVLFMFLWAISCFAYWSTHSFSVLNLSQFIIPLFLITFICTAYSEVNSEGLKVARCIFLYKERVFVQNLFRVLPLQMTVFNYPITINTIMGVGAAFVFALISKILFSKIDN